MTLHFAGLIGGVGPDMVAIGRNNGANGIAGIIPPARGHDRSERHPHGRGGAGTHPRQRRVGPAQIIQSRPIARSAVKTR